jgi:tRNA dimethylallyltransferase
MPTLPILAIGGPTAVGKSAAALSLADALDAAGVSSILVSADSRQVFRGFDIGTDNSLGTRATSSMHRFGLCSSIVSNINCIQYPVNVGLLQDK